MCVWYSFRMDIRIKATDVEMTPELSVFLQERVQMIGKLIGEDPAARCEVEVGRDAGRPRHGEHLWYAEFYVVRSGVEPVRATNRGATLNEAINDAKEEVLRQLRKDKRKYLHVLRRQGARLKELFRFGNDA
jgi:ribosome-associated translation inhibitor RaiA